MVLDKDSHSPVSGASLTVSLPGVAGIKQDQASVYIEIAIAWYLTLSGRVVDDETRDPIPGMHVELVS